MTDGDDWDDEELLLVSGRGKASGKKRHRKASDSDDEQDEEPERPTRAQKSGKRRAAAEEEEPDSDEERYPGMDPEERRQLAEMNELEREMYLFEREEKLQRQRERDQVLNQARKEPEQVEVRASSRRPRTQTGTDSAIGRIAAAHAQREAREKKKQQEEVQKQEKEQRARSRKRQQDDEEQELPSDEDEYEEEEMVEADEEDEEGYSAEDDAAEAEQLQQLGARVETYDEGAGYEELEDKATLEEIQSITLKRSDLERWHNEPFFEEDLRGCLLRIVNNSQPQQQSAGQPSYILARIADVVVRNSYTFPAGSKTRTRKWLHMDDLSGSGVFRHQMTMVSNSEVTQDEYGKAVAKSQRKGAKFTTKGDVQQAKERLEHARNFKYNHELVKQMVEKKRAAGKMAGSAAQIRARLKHEINLARQEGKEEQLQRLQEELDRFEEQEKAKQQRNEDLFQQALEEKDKEELQSVTSKLPPDMALAVINMRNRGRNNLKVLQNIGPSKTAAASKDGAIDVFARRHTTSKVYWSTKTPNKEGEGQQQAAAIHQQQQLQRQGSGAAEVSLLKHSLKKLDPAELIKVLELSLDLGQLQHSNPAGLLPKRVLGLRWYQTVQKRQQEMAGRSLLTLDDWKRKMAYQMGAQ